MVLDKCGDVSQLHYADRKHTQLRNTRKLKAWLRAGKTVELRERDKVTCCWPLNSFLLLSTVMRERSMRSMSNVL